MHQRIITLLAIVFGLSTAVFGALYFQKENGLPKLPVPASGNSSQRSAAESASLVASDALYYPYYFGAPQYIYTYDLQTDFPALGSETMVYSITGKKYDRAAAVALASRFGLTGDPIEQESSFIFSEGTTPGAGSSGSSGSGSSDTTANTSTDSSGPGITSIPSEEKSTIEPTTVVDPSTVETKPEPLPAESYTGRQLTISTDGSVSYYDYSAVRTNITATPDDAETKNGSQLPEGVADREAAIGFAVNYLRTAGLLPADYEATASDPYGSFSVTITPKRSGYAIQSGAITAEIANQGALASLYYRDVVVADFHPYPTKNAGETLQLQTLTYKITQVAVKYASSYDENGVEYAQPVYVLTGTDSLGNDFTFEIPAVKAEFLDSNRVIPLREGFPAAF